MTSDRQRSSIASSGGNGYRNQSVTAIFWTVFGSLTWAHFQMTANGNAAMMRTITEERLPMQHVQLNDALYKEAERRAREAGFRSVDEFVADRLESDFSDAQEDFDDRFTPQVVARLDQISDDMKAAKSVSAGQVDQHLADVREAWLKNHAS
jgi:hypothetical protein